jgi:hypothetical protein
MYIKQSFKGRIVLAHSQVGKLVSQDISNGGDGLFSIRN